MESQRDREQHHGKKERPWHSVEQERRTNYTGQHTRQPELARKTAEHPVNGICDSEGEERSEDDNTEQTEPGVGPRQQHLIAPTVGDPRAIGRGARQDAGMRNGQMLDYPVANFEMPPDVEVEHAEFPLDRKST